MENYIAMLRGINVSGQKKIKMTELKSHFEELNFKDVQTYIQSGNVIFKYESTNPAMLCEMIEQKIFEKYGFEVTVIVKTPSEFEYVISNNPFLRFPDKNPDRIYLTCLSEMPLKSDIDRLKGVDYSPEEFFQDEKNIYLYSPLGYGRAKMNNNFFEQKLKVKATTRNWKTVNKLFEMAVDKK